MKTFKFILRVIVSLVLFIPTSWILWLSFSAFGLFFFVPIIGFMILPFNWLQNNEENIEENLIMISMIVPLVLIPFTFWYYFIIGIDPFKKMEC